MKIRNNRIVMKWGVNVIRRIGECRSRSICFQYSHPYKYCKGDGLEGVGGSEYYEQRQPGWCIATILEMAKNKSHATHFEYAELGEEDEMAREYDVVCLKCGEITVWCKYDPPPRECPKCKAILSDGEDWYGHAAKVFGVWSSDGDALDLSQRIKTGKY